MITSNWRKTLANSSSAILAVLLFVTLAMWVSSTAPFSEPDARFHYASIMCGRGTDDGVCELGTAPEHRLVPAATQFEECYKPRPIEDDDATSDEDAASAEDATAEDGRDAGPSAVSCAADPSVLVDTANLNSNKSYPPLYYWVTKSFASTNPESTFRSIRLFNVTLFCATLAAISALIPARRRQTLWLVTAITIVPLGLSVIASINPSAPALYGPLLVYTAVRGAFETSGARRWALVMLSALITVFVCGTRYDAGFYTVLAAVLAIFVAMRFTKKVALAWGAIVVLALAAIYLNQTLNLLPIFDLTPVYEMIRTALDSTSALGHVIVQNTFDVPYIWGGLFGTWALGSFDIPMPRVVIFGATASFVAVLFFSIRRPRVREMLALVTIAVLLVLMPVAMLYRTRSYVGEWFQPRYIFPLIALFAIVLMWTTPKRRLNAGQPRNTGRPVSTQPPLNTAPLLNTAQTWTVIACLTVAQYFALRANTNHTLASSPTGELWWPSWALSPSLTKALGGLAFALFVIGVFYLFRPSKRQEGASEEPAVVVTETPAPETATASTPKPGRHKAAAAAEDTTDPLYIAPDLT